MFGRKPEPPPQWSIETLREYLLAMIAGNDVRYAQRFDASQEAVMAAFAAQKQAIDAALAAAKEAVNKAEFAAERRFESVNEFRATLSDQQRSLMPRSEAEVLIKALTDKLDVMEKTVASMSGQRSGMSTAIGVAIAIGGIVIGVLSHFIK